MPPAGAKRKATTVAVKKTAKGTSTSKRGKVSRAALGDVANAVTQDASAEAPAKEKAGTGRVTRGAAKRGTGSAATKGGAFEAFVEPGFGGEAPVAAAVAKAAGNGVALTKEHSLESVSNTSDPKATSIKVNTSATVSGETIPFVETEEAAKPLPPIAHDPLLCTWYTRDIFQLFRDQELDFRASEDYMENFDRDINAQMRGILIDWIVEVGEMYGLHDQTIYLCTNYLDRYVSSHIVPRSSLQLVGVTCLQIASKYSEVSCPTGEQFAYISVTPIGEIMKMERKILESLSYRLCVVSGLDFCAHYCRVCGASDITSMLARYFLELTLQEYSFLKYPASTAAAASVKIALWYHDRISWDAKMSAECDHAGDDLRPCAEAMQAILRRVHESTLPAVKEKYSHGKCLRVSDFCFETLVLEEEETMDTFDGIPETIV